MRRREQRLLLSSEATQRIEEVRGATSAEQWVEEAVSERLMRDRFLPGWLGSGPLGDIYLAVIEEGGHEGVLLMRVHMPGLGDTLVPVMARDDEGMRDWENGIALELGMMDGPPIRWRKWVKEGMIELDYLRRESPECES